MKLGLLCCVLGAFGAQAATPLEALSAHGVSVVDGDGGGVPDALAAELWEGLQAIPEKLRRVPGAPLTIELRDAPAPFGMGDGTPTRPDWRGGTFLLYAFEEPEDRRAQYRLENLSTVDRERLWRRRAIVYAVLKRWNDRLRWSQRDAWKRTTGWVEAGDHLLAFREHPRNEYDWAYSRARGRQSAAADLLTFAEEALVPVESVAPDALPVDDQVRCQEFSKSRFLASILGEERLRPRHQECPAFSRWADLGNLSHIEALLSAPSGQRLQSLFGHLMLRPTYRNAPGETRNTDPVIEVAAITGFTEHPLEFLAYGTVGGYFNAFEELSVATVRAEHVDRDARNVRRFALPLTDEEEVRVVERLWEAQRRGYYPYRFFSDNCASYVAFILNGVVAPERVAELRNPIVLPTGVLDLLNGERTPDSLLSHRTVALRAERDQDQALAELARVAPQLAAEWAAVVREARRPSLASRHAAYRKLPQLISSTSKAEHASLVLKLVDASVKMERYAAQEAQEQAQALDLARIQVPPGTKLPSTEELIAQRQKRYEREAGANRLHESLRRFVQWARFLEALPRRAPTEEEIAIAERAAHTRELFLSLTATYAELVDQHRALAQTGTYREAPWPKVRSGLGRLSVGGGAAQTGAGPVQPELVLRSAFLDERLGDRRANGLDPLAEVRLLESTLRWRVGRERPTFEELELNVLRARTMPREPALMRTNVLHSLGFGAGASYRRDREGTQSYLAHAEVVVPLAASSEYEHHLLLGLGPQLGASGALLPGEATAGGRLELSGRTQLPLRAPAAVRFDASWSPLFRVLGPSRVWTHQARAALHLELAPSSHSRAQVELLFNARFRWAPGQWERTLGAALAIGTP